MAVGVSSPQSTIRSRVHSFLWGVPDSRARWSFKKFQKFSFFFNGNKGAFFITESRRRSRNSRVLEKVNSLTVFSTDEPWVMNKKNFITYKCDNFVFLPKVTVVVLNSFFITKSFRRFGWTSHARDDGYSSVLYWARFPKINRHIQTCGMYARGEGKISACWIDNLFLSIGFFLMFFSKKFKSFIFSRGECARATITRGLF